MIAEIGHYALVLALGLALIQACVPLVGAWLRDDTLIGVAGPCHRQSQQQRSLLR